MKRYSRVTYENRYQILAPSQGGILPAKMTSQIRLDKSTIYRELHRKKTCRRNSFIKTYSAKKAHCLVLERRKNCRRSPKMTATIRKEVGKPLEEKHWSPEMIAGRLVYEGIIRITPKTVYWFVAIQKIPPFLW